MYQDWFCEACGKKGCVRHKKDAGVTEVANAIHTHHKKLSRKCDEPYMVRVGLRESRSAEGSRNG